MAWNEPGGSKDQDPWGRRNKQSGPPHLDDLFRKWQNKLRAALGGKGGGTEGGGPAGSGPQASSLGAVVLALAVVWLAIDSIYIIQPAERGVVLRFGQFVDTLQPGPSMRLPRPLEFVSRVDVDQIRTVEIGYRSGGGAQATPTLGESLMLTKDENIVDTRLAVQYKIKDASAYLFQVRNPDETLRQAAESALREAVGKSEMDFILGEGRSDVAARTQAAIQAILDRYNTGLQVTSVNLQDAQAPEQVQDSFLDAIRAREDQERLINEAEAYANEVIPKARGEAARFIEDANAYKARVVAEADGDAQRFLRILSEYEKAPNVTRERMYIESLEQVFARASKVMVDVKQGNSMLYLPLDKIMEQRGSVAPPAEEAAAARPAPPAAAPPQETRPERASRPVREVR